MGLSTFVVSCADELLHDLGPHKCLFVFFCNNSITKMCLA